MERRRVGGRGAAVGLAAAAAGALVAARSAWPIVAAGALLAAAVVVWRRSAPLGIERREEWWRALAAGAALLAAAQLAGLLVRDDGPGQDPVSRSDGRLGLPPAPVLRGVLYAARLADGTVVRAWPAGPGTLHLRVDTSAAPCSGGPWREWWHMADLPALRVADDGTFSGRGGDADARPAARHRAAYRVRGVVAGGVVRGTLVRTDRYRGHVDGACRRTVRFTAAASR